MSRRTKLIALAIFMVLLGVPLGYVAITWHPASPLTFHLEPVEVTVGNDNNLGAYRAYRVRIENSSLAPVEFHGATVAVKAGSLVFRDAPPGMILTSSLTGPHSNAVEYLLVVPARGHILADAALAPALMEEIPKENVFAAYQWQSLPRSKAGSMVDWLREHGPAWAVKHLPAFTWWEDVIPLEGTPPPEIKPSIPNPKS